jgi:hypothetical protein
MKKRIWLLGLVILLVVVLVGAAVWYNYGFRQGADVTTNAQIKVYPDSGMAQEIGQGNLFSWGAVSTGQNVKSVWVKNTGSVDVTLQFNYDGQQLPGDWTETWNYNGDPLTVGSNIEVVFTLTLPDNVGAGHYEWNCGIAATEYTPP